MSEYNDFLNSPKKSPPAELNSAVHSLVNNDINPNVWSVTFKFLLIHILMSSLTLIICPQFGIGPIGGNNGIVGFIEQYGHIACGLFCGSFFFFGSLVLANFVLSRGQKRVISSHSFGISISLALLSFFTLIIISHMLNGHIHHIHAEFLVSWIVSAFGLVLATTKVFFKKLQIAH